MNHLSTRLIVLFCAAGVSVCATGATPPVSDAAKVKAPPTFGQLAPTDIQAIQGLGRAVLAAKGAPDPAQEALRNDMKALSVTLDQTLTASLLTPPVLKLDKGRTMSVVQNGAQTLQFTAPTPQYKLITGPDGKATQLEMLAMPVVAPTPGAENPTPQISSPGTSVGKDRYAAIRNQLTAVRQRTDLLTASPQTRSTIQNARTAGILSKSKSLHDEFLLALDEASTNDATKLTRLRDRIRPKTLAQVLTERKDAVRLAGEPIPESTPTISIRTHHR